MLQGISGHRARSEGAWRRLAYHKVDRFEQRPPGRSFRKGGLAGEHLEQDQSQCVDVGALVDGFGSGFSSGVERVEMFGRHVR